MINDLIALATVMIAISLATERLVIIIKTIAPSLGQERTANGQPDPKADRPRMLLVQAISYIAAFITSSLLTGDWSWKCYEITKTLCLAPWQLAVLGMGGSAFWTSIVGYARAVKDIQQQNKAMRMTENARLARLNRP